MREYPPDVLRRAAEIIGSPYRCNSDPRHNQAQADILNYVAEIWTDTAMPPRHSRDTNPYPVRRRIQNLALALANAIVGLAALTEETTCSTCGGAGEVRCLAHIAGDECVDMVFACPDCLTEEGGQ